MSKTIIVLLTLVAMVARQTQATCASGAAGACVQDATDNKVTDTSDEVLSFIQHTIHTGAQTHTHGEPTLFDGSPKTPKHRQPQRTQLMSHEPEEVVVTSAAKEPIAPIRMLGKSDRGEQATKKSTKFFRKTKKEDPAHHLPICDVQVVGEACMDFGSGADSDDKEVAGFVTSEDIASMLAASHENIMRFWSELGLPTNTPTEDGHGFSMKCKTLCANVASYIEEESVLPPSSDMGCYVKANGNIACDLDLSPESFHFTTSGDLPDPHDAEVANEDGGLGLDQTLAGAQRRTRHGRLEHRRSGVDSNRTDYPVVHAEEEISYTVWEVAERVANFFRIYPVPNPSTGAGVSFVQRFGQESAGLEQCNDVVSAVSAKSKAWTSLVIGKVQLPETHGLLQKWFGSTAGHTRSEVLRILNGVEHMLSNVKYVIPGPECTPDTYGYVYPHGDNYCWSWQLDDKACKTDYYGNYVIYLCELFCDSDESEQIETITHEGSHHGSQYLDDVAPDPYGRDTCEQMAIDNPAGAIKNADSFCYYLADVAMGVDDNAPQTCPHLPSCSLDSSCSCAQGYSQILTQTGAGADCWYCGTPPAGPPPNDDSCRYARDNECDEPEWCDPGTDTTDCSAPSGTHHGCECAPPGPDQTPCATAANGGCCSPDNDPGGSWCYTSNYCHDHFYWANWDYC